MVGNRIKKIISLATLGLVAGFASSVAAFEFSSHLANNPADNSLSYGNRGEATPQIILVPLQNSLSLQAGIHDSAPMAMDGTEIILTYNTELCRSSLTYSLDKSELFNGFTSSTEHHHLQADSDFQLGHFYVSSEFTWDLTETHVNADGLSEKEFESFTFKLDSGAQLGNINAGLMYSYIYGTENHYSLSGLQQPGSAYIINNSEGGFFHWDMVNSYAPGTFTPDNGLHTLVLHSDLALSERLNLHGGVVAYGMSGDEQMSYGMGIDVGASYAILNNLIYKVHFGYLDAGRIFAKYSPSNNPEDMYLLTNHLTMEF